METQDMSDKETRNEQENTHSHVSHNRRTLIKSAAAAAPVVLTLRSGAAAALASNDQCIARDQQIAKNTPPPAATARGDTWVRTQTICRTLTRTGLTSPITVYLDPGSGDWYQADDPNRIYTEQSPTTMVLKNSSPPDIYTIASTTDPCLVLVLFDSQGNPIGFGDNSTTNVGLPITNSCWASINPIP